MADVISIYGNPIKDAVARADISTLQTDVQGVKSDLNYKLDLFGAIPGTTQTVTMTDGKPTQILHKKAGTTVRTDTITYTDTTITEARTLAGGKSITMTTDLETLTTTVTEVA